MPGNFWENDEQVTPQAAAPSAPRPIISVPDYRGRDDARADESLRITQENAARAGRNEADQNDQQRFQRQSSLRSAYDSNPEVKNYRVVVPQLIDALQTPNDPSGDNALLYAYAKIMDPGSVVRESEQENAASGASVIDSTVARLKKQFGVEGGGLAPNVREGLRRQALARVQQLGRIYRQQRQRYTDDATAEGIDPVRVIGPDDFEPYVQQFQAYQDRQSKGQPSAPSAGRSPSGIRDPEMRGGLPVGTEIQWSADQAEEPFDHDRWLKETYGMTPDQEPQVTAFWNQNRGNPRLTVDAAKGWYASKGIPTPDDGSLADAVAKAREGAQFGGFDDTAAREEYTNRLRADLKREGFDPNSAGAYADRVGQGVLATFGDEISGVGGAVDALVNNRGVADGYRLARDRQREAFAQEDQAQGWVGDALELAGGLVGGAGAASRAPITAARAAGEGAAFGALTGFGSGEGLGDSLGSATLGGVTGAGLGYGIGRGVEALAARRAAQAGQPLSDGGQVISAADRLNNQFGTKIAPLPADVAGATTRRATGAAAQLPLSAGSIVRGAENVSSEAKAARDAIASLTGTAATDEAAGEAALQGANKYIKSSQTKVNALYAKARRLGGDQPVDLANARQVLDDNITELSQTPGGAPGLAELQKLRGELDAAYPVEGVKRMRTTLRDRFIGDGLRSNDLERRVGQVVDAAEIDVADALAAAGKGDAASAYQQAAAAHKERVGVIDNVLEPIIGKGGKNSVEDVMRAIDTATKTKGARLGKFLGSLPQDDAATVRAKLISNLGRASAGGQDATGTAFSLPQFLTQWNKMSSRAKSELFGGEVRAALEDLAKVAEGTKEAQRFANFSNTGSVVGALATGAGAAGFFAAPISSSVALASQYGAGKLLASPKFARWLAKMPSQPAAIERHVSALTKIAANDNAIAQDVLGLKSALEAVVAPTYRSVAAPAPSAGTSAGPERGERR